jgi:hypothetical protein
VPKKHVFKSKFRDDKVVLVKIGKVKEPDGSTTVTTDPVYADFSHNTWASTNQELAEKLRQRIADGLDPNNPLPALHIIETTKEIAKEAKPAE